MCLSLLIVLKVFQMVAWTSRLVSSIIMASLWFHPDLEIFPKAAQYRSYLIICLSIELVVSILFLLSLEA